MSCKRIKILAVSGFSLIPGSFVWIVEKGAQSKREWNNCSKKMPTFLRPFHKLCCAGAPLWCHAKTSAPQFHTFICFHPGSKLPENFPAWNSGCWRMETGFPSIIQTPRVTAIWTVNKHPVSATSSFPLPECLLKHHVVNILSHRCFLCITCISFLKKTGMCYVYLFAKYWKSHFYRQKLGLPKKSSWKEAHSSQKMSLVI